MGAAEGREKKTLRNSATRLHFLSPREFKHTRRKFTPCRNDISFANNGRNNAMSLGNWVFNSRDVISSDGEEMEFCKQSGRREAKLRGSNLARRLVSVLKPSVHEREEKIVTIFPFFSKSFLDCVEIARISYVFITRPFTVSHTSCGTPQNFRIDQMHRTSS